jgi:hypothetical protein
MNLSSSLGDKGTGRQGDWAAILIFKFLAGIGAAIFACWRSPVWFQREFDRTPNHRFSEDTERLLP